MLPSSHSTKPDGIDRHADPEPCRARIDSCFSVNLSPAAAAAATVNAAKPDAEEERPVELGKLFWETTLALRLMSASLRMRSRWAETRCTSEVREVGGVREIRVKLSRRKFGENSTVVVVSRLERHMEMLPFSGRRSFSSLRPQYLVKAMLDGAIAVAL